MANAESKIAELMLDRHDAAALIRSELGIPADAVDLERADVVHRKWGQRTLYRRADVLEWPLGRLSPPLGGERRA